MPPEGPTGSVWTGAQGRRARGQREGSAWLAGPRRSASDGVSGKDYDAPPECGINEGAGATPLKDAMR